MSFLRSFNQDEVDLKKLGVDDELFKLLYDIGILGLTRSYFVHTEKIFDGYLAANPESQLATLGMGLLGIARANYGMAEETFKILLEMDEEHDIARAYLGLVYKCQNKKNEAKKELQAVIDANREESAVALAKATLEKLEE